jgi:predicted dehydrogenase/nucleoside-diphosphate-sugar epimerase
MPQPEKLIRIVIIGCGAISQKAHLPILAGHEKASLVALVDRDIERATKLARAYGVKEVFSDIEKVDKGLVDAAIIATPPKSHAPYAIKLAKRGIHVLVEKPMAMNYEEAQMMVRAAEENGVVLSVNFFRRLLPSARLLKALVESNWWGKPIRFHFKWGSFYDWQATSLGNMIKQEGGGVLYDLGPHALDWLSFIFGSSAEVLEYRSNALGGAEADCSIRIRCHRQDGPIEGLVELGRTRELGALLKIECEKSSLELQIGERYKVRVNPNDLRLEDFLLNVARTAFLDAKWRDEEEKDWFEVWRAVIDDWFNAICLKKQPQLSGHSVLPVVKLLDECNKNPQPLDEPWACEGISIRKSPETSRRVLITGSCGFIGCRTAEILKLRDGWDVRALVHNPNHASRLARLPVEMVMGDLRSKEDMRRAIKGCDAVVHCGIGTAYGQLREIFAVTVGGTKNLAEAALEAGVKRFIHISTATIHQPKATGVIDETTPVCPRKKDDYTQSKAQAEQAVAKAVHKGLSAAILRPATVYGPFAPLMLVGPGKKLLEGKLFIPKNVTDVLSNTVYIDNVVEVIARVLQAQDNLVKGEAFIVNDDDDFTYGEFYGYFAKALGIELCQSYDAAEGIERKNNSLGWGRGISEIIRSPELRALFSKVLQTEPLGRLPKAVLEKSPCLERWLCHLAGTDAPLIYRRPRESSKGVLIIQPSVQAKISADKIRRVLGYSPPVSRERAMKLTLDWIRYAGLA